MLQKASHPVAGMHPPSGCVPGAETPQMFPLGLWAPRTEVFPRGEAGWRLSSPGYLKWKAKNRGT